MSIATGIITNLDPATCSARVKLPDRDGIVTDWLPVLQRKTLLDKVYWLPDINEHVAVLLDDNAEAGVILGAIYSEADTPPVSSADIDHITYKDGTVIEYDRSTHKLTADVKGDVTIKATGKLEADITGAASVKTSSTLSIESTGNATITTPLLTVTGNMSITGTLQTPKMTVTSDKISMTGSIEATGNITDGGSNTNHHSH